MDLGSPDEKIQTFLLESSRRGSNQFSPITVIKENVVRLDRIQSHDNPLSRDDIPLKPLQDRLLESPHNSK